MASFQEKTPRRRRACQEKKPLNRPDSSVTLLHRLAGLIGAGYLRFVSATSFVLRSADPGSLRILREKKPLVYAFWHNRQVFLAYEHGHEGVYTMVSQSADGEYIAQVMKRLGAVAVRGSTSRGGKQALMEICDLVKNGQRVGFTPDGPRGPMHTVHGGVVMAAQSSGAPIIPLTYLSRRKIVFPSWDKFVVPLPFSVIIAKRGKPFTVPMEMPLETAQALVADRLNQTEDEADARFQTMPPWGDALVGAIFAGAYTLFSCVLIPVLAPLLMMRYGWKRSAWFLKERFSAPRDLPASSRRWWFHAASVGEWQALKPILRALPPVVSPVVTVSTPEARVLVEKEAPEIFVRLLPVDMPWIVNRWIKRVKPAAMILVETEIWPNLIAALYKNFIPTFVVNGRLSLRSVRRWKWVRPFAQRLTSRVFKFFVRTELDGNHYYQLGATLDQLVVTGNTKYDNLAVEPFHAARVQETRRRHFGGSDGVYLIAGSTWPGEEEALLGIFSHVKGARPRLIIAPRRLERVSEIKKMLEGTAVSWSLWSHVMKTNVWETDALVVDTFGDLASLYKTADAAFVGGSLYPQGGQNPLEPAAAGLPVLFGPKMQNFHDEAAGLKKAGGARQAFGKEELLASASELLNNAALRETMGQASARFVREKQGASNRTVDALKDLLSL